MIFGIVCCLESMGEIDILFKIIGEIVMEVFVCIDIVVYVCFVLVYKNF